MIEESRPFVIAVLGLAGMVVLSAAGATIGSTKASSAAAMIANRHADIITKAYLPVLLSSACFVYAMMLVMVAFFRIASGLTYGSAGMVGAAGIIYGSAALFAGIALGETNKKGILHLGENKRFFLAFLVLNSTVELVVIFALICAVLMITGK